VTESLSEPINVGPVVGGHLRASDADREQVMTLLSTAYAEGRLTSEEHDERVARVLAARTFDDLLPVTDDLVALAPQGPRSGNQASDHRLARSDPSSQPDRMVAVFGGVNRKGRWRVRSRIQALAVFGGMDLDLREAVFDSPVVEISGFWCCGGLTVTVPAGMEVQDQVSGLCGGIDVRDLGDPQPGAPTLVIRGLAMFGGVSVKGPGAGGQTPGQQNR
jgi:hypothetical protein